MHPACNQSSQSPRKCRTESPPPPGLILFVCGLAAAILLFMNYRSFSPAPVASVGVLPLAQAGTARTQTWDGQSQSSATVSSATASHGTLPAMLVQPVYSDTLVHDSLDDRAKRLVRDVPSSPRLKHRRLRIVTQVALPTPRETNVVHLAGQPDRLLSPHEALQEAMGQQIRKQLLRVFDGSFTHVSRTGMWGARMHRAVRDLSDSECHELADFLAREKTRIGENQFISTGIAGEPGIIHYGVAEYFVDVSDVVAAAAHIHAPGTRWWSVLAAIAGLILAAYILKHATRRVRQQPQPAVV
jgi:hypothetical protein